MPNITDQKGVLILDTAADNIVPSNIIVKIKKIRMVGATAAGQMRLTDAGNSQSKVAAWSGSAAPFFTDDADFAQDFVILRGLRLLDNAPAGALLYVYTR